MTASLVLADRLRGVESSPTLALAAKAKALQHAGKLVVDLTAGEPDFPTPEPIKQAGIAAIERNQTRYTPAEGTQELRAAIAADLSQRLGLTYAASQVVVSCGAKHALYNLLQVLCQPGDEVMLFSPYWVSYVPMVRLAGATPVLVPLQEAHQFQPDLALVRAAVTERTRVLILNSPSNPTGMLIERARLGELATLSIERDLSIISDEIYDQLVYPPQHPCSIVQAEPKVVNRTMLVNGVSKTYSMTGWRIGYSVAPQAVTDALVALQSHSTSNPTSISQAAALQAITGDQAPVARMASEFQQRRDRLVKGLNRLPGLSCVLPDGAFYAWCNVSRLGQSAEVIAGRWLEDALVAVVPGEGFGSSEHVRLSFATSLQTIDEALVRLKRWLER